MILREIYEPIETELQAVEEILGDRLEAIARRSVPGVAEYLLDGGGKRIRPALVLLSAGASANSGLGHRSADAVSLAAAAELIHLASLIHDDVVDRADIRRGAPTAYARLGRVLSVALGDLLFSMAWELVCGIRDLRAVRSLLAAARPMCEGQLLQLASRGDFQLSEERCLEIAEKKTGSLFAAASRAGATVAHAPDRVIGGLTEYGRNLGIAFQIVDDCLDLVGDEVSLGKPPGQDLLVGEMTLPLVHLRERLPEEGRAMLATALGTGRSKDALNTIGCLLVDSGAPTETKNAALAYVSLAEAGLRDVEESPYRGSLMGLAAFVADRGFGETPQGYR